MITQYISIGISIFGFLVTVASWGYILGKNQATTLYMKEQIAQNKVDYKERFTKRNEEQEKTTLRLHSKIEALENKEIVSKSDCRTRALAYDTRLHEIAQTFCGHIEKMSNKLNSMEVKLERLIEKGNKDN